MLKKLTFWTFSENIHKWLNGKLGTLAKLSQNIFLLPGLVFIRDFFSKHFSFFPLDSALMLCPLPFTIRTRPAEWKSFSHHNRQKTYWSLTLYITQRERASQCCETLNDTLIFSVLASSQNWNRFFWWLRWQIFFLFVWDTAQKSCTSHVLLPQSGMVFALGLRWKVLTV